MEELKFEKPKIMYEKFAEEYINEFLEYGSEINGTGGLQRYMNNYQGWLEKIRNDEKIDMKTNEKVPAETFFVIRNIDKRIVGMVNIRKRLNEELIIHGGHIGYSIRPTERRKGYGTEILKMALNELKKINVKKVLITCNKDNIGSSRVIMNNAGKLENEIVNKETGKEMQRYWIEN